MLSRTFVSMYERSFISRYERILIVCMKDFFIKIFYVCNKSKMSLGKFTSSFFFIILKYLKNLIVDLENFRYYLLLGI